MKSTIKLICKTLTLKLVSMIGKNSLNFHLKIIYFVL